ncbi:MAG TPA: benzoate-CoA ligase family protein [Gaiellaceae bacterium]|nr:benzoate-CoA ligase family protein [Gaiellaceae bacterium]
MSDVRREPARFNLAEACVDAQLAAGRAGRPALRYRGATVTYGELAELVARAAGMLRGLGLEREDRCALFLNDSPEFVATFLGAVRLGVVPVPFSTLLRPSDIRYQLENCGARAIVASAELAPLVDEALVGGAARLRLVAAGDGALREWASFEDLVRSTEPVRESAATIEDDWCFWQYSSGTTGRPKAVVHTQRGAAFPYEGHGRQALGIVADDRSFSVSKLFFSYGLGNSLLVPLQAGACVVLEPGRPTPQVVFDLIARERPTLVYAVPTAYAAALAYAEEGHAADLSSVRLCISAGEALPAPLYERWRARFGVEILDGIGSTEIGYIAISNLPGRVRPGASGQVLPGYEAKVVGDDGRPVPAGEVGDLWVRGGSTSLYYWRDRARTKRTYVGDWIVTGDKYVVDGDGYYAHAGRSDDMLKVSGLWVSPVEVEACLIEHPAVLESGVVGRADGDSLVKPCAFVVLKEGREPSADLAAELQAFVRGRLAPYKYPRWIEFTAELPKTSTGKIQRYRLRATA